LHDVTQRKPARQLHTQAVGHDRFPQWIARRDDDHWDRPDLFICILLLQNGIAILVGQPKIEQHQVWTPLPHKGEGASAVPGMEQPVAVVCAV